MAYTHLTAEYKGEEISVKFSAVSDGDCIEDILVEAVTICGVDFTMEEFIKCSSKLRMAILALNSEVEFL